MGALAHPVDEAYEFLLTLRRRADDDQQALRIVLEPGLHMDAVGPEVDIVPGRQIPLQPVRVLVRPNLGEPRHGRGRQAAGVRPEQGRQRLGEVARGDALEVEGGDQDFEALRAPRIRRQERGAEPDALGALARAVANAWRANRNRADAGHDLAFGQVAVAHQPSAAFFGARLGVAIKERGNLRLDRPRQQGPGAAAQHLGQRIGKRRWLGKLQNVTCLSMKVRSPMPCSCSCLSPTRSQRRRRELHGADSDMAQRLETAMAHTLRLGSLAELHG